MNIKGIFNHRLTFKSTAHCWEPVVVQFQLGIQQDFWNYFFCQNQTCTEHHLSQGIALLILFGSSKSEKYGKVTLSSISVPSCFLGFLSLTQNWFLQIGKIIAIRKVWDTGVFFCASKPGLMGIWFEYLFLGLLVWYFSTWSWICSW